jgi:hypothetical protein
VSVINSDVFQKRIQGSFSNTALKNKDLIDIKLKFVFFSHLTLTKFSDAMTTALKAYETEMNVTGAISNSLFNELHKVQYESE